MAVVTIGEMFSDRAGAILNLARRDPIEAHRKAITLARWIQKIPLTSDPDENDQRSAMVFAMDKIIQQIKQLIYQSGKTLPGPPDPTPVSPIKP